MCQISHNSVAESEVRVTSSCRNYRVITSTTTTSTASTSTTGTTTTATTSDATTTTPATYHHHGEPSPAKASNTIYYIQQVLWPEYYRNTKGAWMSTCNDVTSNSLHNLHCCPAAAPANTPLLVQYCPNIVSCLRRVWTESVYLYDI